MHAQTIGIVMVRLFSIYLVMAAIQSLSYVVPALFSFAAGSTSTLGKLAAVGSVTFWIGLTSIALPAVCAWWLWRNAERVVPDGTAVDKADSNASDLMLVGVSLIGLYLLVWGVINFVRVEAGMAMNDRFLKDSAILQRVPYITQILIAIPMLLGRRRLADLLIRAKFAGTNAGRQAD